MSRISNDDYLCIRSQLRQIWLHQQDAFARLSPSEQWALHVYFHPATDLTDTEALEHRRDITQLEPRLPQRAGRALAAFNRGSSPRAVTRAGKLHVRAVVQPEIDTQALARVLIDIGLEWMGEPPRFGTANPNVQTADELENRGSASPD